jgi:hypothetical protein
VSTFSQGKGIHGIHGMKIHAHGNDKHDEQAKMNTLCSVPINATPSMTRPCDLSVSSWPSDSPSDVAAPIGLIGLIGSIGSIVG